MNGDTNAALLTVHEALRLIWEADRYPILGNEDRRAADALERDALAKAAQAVPCAGDPPEFADWLAMLRDQAISNHDRFAVMEKLYDLFKPD